MLELELADVRVRVGVDLVKVERMHRLLTDHPAALDTLFTEREQRYCLGKRRRYEHLAARFAAKEAVLKAFGTGLGQRMLWTDVEIVNEVLGRPRVYLHGEVAALAKRRGLLDLDVSLSHTSDLAIAHAAALWGRRPMAIDTDSTTESGGERTDFSFES